VLINILRNAVRIPDDALVDVTVEEDSTFTVRDTGSEEV
jgi:signal transduction histidine kinase